MAASRFGTLSVKTMLFCLCFATRGSADLEGMTASRAGSRASCEVTGCLNGGTCNSSPIGGGEPYCQCADCFQGETCQTVKRCSVARVCPEDDGVSPTAKCYPSLEQSASSGGVPCGYYLIQECLPGFALQPGEGKVQAYTCGNSSDWSPTPTRRCLPSSDTDATVPAGWDTSVCRKILANEGPSLPKVPNSFVSHIQMNKQSSRTTVELKEVFDGRQNRGVLRMRKGGTDIKLIYQYATNELFTIIEKLAYCGVTDLDKTTPNYVFGTQSEDGSVYTGAGALHFGAGFQEMFMGREFVRGIPSLHWQSCIFDARSNSTMKVDYYWSDKTAWTPAFVTDGAQSIPLRAIVNGVTVSDRAGRHNFQHIYDFVNFKSGDDVINDAAFRIPEGLYCKRKFVYKMPEMPQFFSFRSEMVTPDWNKLGLPYSFISPQDEWYDFNVQVFKIRYNPIPDAEELQNSASFFEHMSHGELEEIHDYRTGLAYKTDTYMGNCTIMPLTSSDTHPESDDSLSSAQTLTMSNPQHFFKYDLASYSYLGEYWERGVKSRVFIGQGNITDDDGTIQPATYQWHFLAENWFEEVGSVMEKSIPMKLVVTRNLGGSMGTFRIIFNMFRFDAESPKIIDFDVLPCYKNLPTRDFMFSLSGQFKDLVSRNLNSFKYEVLRVLMQKTKILSALRINRIEVDMVTAEKVKVVFTLLEMAPEQQTREHQSDVRLREAADNLKSAVAGGQLVFVMTDKGVRTSLVAEKESLVEVTRGFAGHKQQDIVEEITHFSAGELAGCGIGLFVVGILLGFLVMFVVVRTQKHRPQVDLMPIKNMEVLGSDPLDS